MNHKLARHAPKQTVYCHVHSICICFSVRWQNMESTKAKEKTTTKNVKSSQLRLNALWPLKGYNKPW
jgi:hypothetical protein